jgi:hypothetical protein
MWAPGPFAVRSGFCVRFNAGRAVVVTRLVKVPCMDFKFVSMGAIAAELMQ